MPESRCTRQVLFKEEIIMTNNNNLNLFIENMIKGVASDIFAAETYIDDHDGKEYEIGNVIGFQIRGMKITPIYVSEKYSFSVNPFSYDRKKNIYHLNTASCGGTIMVSQYGSLEKAVEKFNQDHAYNPENEDHAMWSKEFIILARLDEKARVIVEL